MNKKTLGKAAAGFAIVAAAVVGYRTFGWGHWHGAGQGLNLDLSAPDALIVTKSLSTLPRDLLAIPLARDVLREDFLFYYEQNEDRLGLKGSLRRIAYEHELNWGDQLIRMVLDEPADVAVWRDADGSLQHFAIAVSRNGLTRVLEEAGKVALKDSQMRVAGTLKVDGDEVSVFALDYGSKRTLLVAAHAQRLVILSHPGMLYRGADGNEVDSKAADTVVGLLGKDAAKQHAFHRQFLLPEKAVDGHTVAVKADYLSFGYQPFFSGLQALRFDFSKGAWRSQALVDGTKLGKGGYDSSALWPVLPHNPSACFTVPVDWAAMEPVLKALSGNASEVLTPLATQMHGPAAACWYGHSRLHTPVFVATRSGASDALFGSLFGAAVGGNAKAVKPATQGGAMRWQQPIGTAVGNAAPTLAVSGDIVVFSADPKLVDQVLAVRRKQGAAASDRMPDAARTVGVIAPASLAQLIQKEAFSTLPARQEPVLRGAADAHLVPRLNALKKYPPYRMVLKQLPRSGVAWEPLEWQTIGN
ncbi:DUF2138 family protein [Pseudoduganella plicata]|uniref:DUF2138 domain-containing protein n=1 Tax=Pseudoduganella plicata TaxID=321984 RepID=A0A4V1ATY7_9BURK|nr:DUF2138 family protein [Pseudoduganella plicata]QBQ37308.1 DUF2138 family protein [Pseudoduganella plicata]GGZ11212.1 DUF2138 domain-containing protein [Pseudoduganella plicata]